MPANAMTEKNQFVTKELTLFVVLASVFSWPVVLLIIAQLPPDFKTGDIDSFTRAVGSINMLYGFGPMISAIIVTLMYKGKSGLKDLFTKVVTWRIPLQWYGYTLLLPVMSQWTGLFLWAQLTGTELQIPTLTEHLWSWLQITVIATAYYVTEEVGWRGFMLSRVLSIYPWIKSSLLVGIIWGIWHYPLWITSAWATTGSLREGSLIVAANTTIVVGISVIVTWIFKNSKESVLLAMLFHGANQAHLTKMYAAAGDSALHGSTFILVQAMTFSVMVVLVLLVIRMEK